MHPRLVPLLALLAFAAACTTAVPAAPPAAGVDPVRAETRVTCGGPGFPVSVLSEPGAAEQNADPAAVALRRHLATGGPDVAWLPATGWREAVRTDDSVIYIAEAPELDGPPLVEVSIERVDGEWSVGGWGQCWPTADVGPDLGQAEFRVAPGVELTAETTELDVLVTERACNSGTDAAGRIVAPAIIPTDEAVTVVFAVVPRPGAHTCPSNPETPFRLELPEPLGDRILFDGSSMPPRDATTCPPILGCG